MDLLKTIQAKGLAAAARRDSRPPAAGLMPDPRNL